MSEPLNYDQFKTAIDQAEARFAALRAIYPKMKAYLVLFLRGDQTGIRSTGSEILKAIPGMVADNQTKAALRSHLKQEPGKEAKDSVVKAWNEQRDVFEKALFYDPNARIEIRFNNLDYTLIAQLQADELVDRNLTPQTAASIRIALGTLGDLHKSANSAS